MQQLKQTQIAISQYKICTGYTPLFPFVKCTITPHPVGSLTDHLQAVDVYRKSAFPWSSWRSEHQINSLTVVPSGILTHL